MVDRTPAHSRFGLVGKIVGFGKTDGVNNDSGDTQQRELENKCDQG